MADAPPKKKLPFKQRKKPTTITPTPSDENAKDVDELDLFSRRKEMQPILEADRKRRLEKERRKAEAQQKDQARERKEQEERQRITSEKRPLEDDEEFFDAKERQSIGGPADDEAVATDEPGTAKGDSFSKPVTPPASKRSRTESGSVSSRHQATPSTSRRQGSPSLRRGPRLRSAVSTPSKAPSMSNQSGQAVISLDSDDDDMDVKPAVKPSQRETIDILDEAPVLDETDEDDEFSRYIRKAEEENKRFPAEAGSSARVLLTSEIEGTAPLELKMKLDQSLTKLREAWVKNQLYKHDVQLPCPAADLILCWQRAKVYSHSTLYSLGIRVQGDTITGTRKGISSDGKKVHMEVSTPEIFERWEAERERQRRKNEAHDLPDDDDEVVQVPVVEDVKLRIVLKARGLDELRLTVRPETTAQTLVAAFKKSRQVGDEKTVTLWFDGDQMENRSTLQEADIDDMDTIDAYIN